MLIVEIFLRIAVTLLLFDIGWMLTSVDYEQSKRSPRKFNSNYEKIERNNQQQQQQQLSVWSDWGPWSVCSRSCGGGVTYQMRHCITKSNHLSYIEKEKKRRRRRRRRRQINGCVGLYKRVRLCNKQKCFNEKDFRFEQCASFNNRPFKGQFYFWEPYYAGDECTLNCRPLGKNFFATLNSTVIDGTTCKQPTTSTGRIAPPHTKGICINGQCKSVNSNGVIGNVDNDSQEECSACVKGTCRSINGLYTRPDLPPGYSLVAQIPQGACRIVVQQLKHTRNFLALKNTNGSFIINGDWKFINNQKIEGAGTKFTYIRQDSSTLETIIAPGPLVNGVDILIVNFQTNSGIKYGYSVPLLTKSSDNIIDPPSIKRPNDLSWTNDVSPRDEATKSSHRRMRLRRRFSWKITGVSACSKSCGGGIQASVLSCIREHTQTPVADKRCSHLERPQMHPIRCNVNDCPPQWVSRWSSCSTTCGDGVQQFTHQCQQELSTGRMLIIDEIACPSSRPPLQTKPCKLNPCDNADNELPLRLKDWAVGPWSECSSSCGVGHRTRSVTCPSGECHPENRPKHAEYCNNEKLCIKQDKSNQWLVTEWGHCSAICGTGTQIRSVQCPYNNCSEINKPETSRACSSDKQCEGQWFVGPWSVCSNLTCNGPAKQYRQVVCIVKIRGQSHITNDMTCPMNLKPTIEQLCGNGYCPNYQWYFGDWGPCENCPNEGIQKRNVQCLDVYGRIFTECPENEKPIFKRSCTCHKEEQKFNKLAQDEPEDLSCSDKIRNCYLAVQARLCQYPYYTSHCCKSCKRAQQHDIL